MNEQTFTQSVFYFDRKAYKETLEHNKQRRKLILEQRKIIKEIEEWGTKIAKKPLEADDVRRITSKKDFIYGKKVMLFYLQHFLYEIKERQREELEQMGYMK